MNRILAAIFLGLFVLSPVVLAETLPPRLSDAEFWQMICDFSEPDGYFSSNNYLSNENTFQRVIPALKAAIRPGGVYIGVGPEQNFTYIAALEPRVSFIIDIRRQNMLQHLIYKAAFELSETRAEFLSFLFSRTRPPELDARSSPEDLFEGYQKAASDRELYERSLQTIIRLLTEQHHFTLTTSDTESIGRIYRAFFLAGPDLSYSFMAGPRPGRTPTYSELMTETDGQGRNWSYLANEDNFKLLKDLQGRNLVIPIVGDFAGPKAIRAVAQYLEEHEAPVNAFYTSNVERYLFEDNVNWKTFYSNVEALPIDAKSTFIRAVLNARAYSNRRRNAIRSVTLLSSISELLDGIKEGRITMYEQLNALSR